MQNCVLIVGLKYFAIYIPRRLCALSHQVPGAQFTVNIGCISLTPHAVLTRFFSRHLVGHMGSCPLFSQFFIISSNLNSLYQIYNSYSTRHFNPVWVPHTFLATREIAPLSTRRVGCRQLKGEDFQIVCGLTPYSPVRYHVRFWEERAGCGKGQTWTSPDVFCLIPLRRYIFADFSRLSRIIFLVPDSFRYSHI